MTKSIVKLVEFEVTDEDGKLRLLYVAIPLLELAPGQHCELGKRLPFFKKMGWWGFVCEQGGLIGV